LPAVVTSENNYMSDVNPYQSPAEPTYPVAPPVDDGTRDGLWREGRLLVMHKMAPLPDRCVKSNRPANGRRLRRKLYWHHPAVFLAILAHLLIYIILALVLRKKATIHIGLSDEWFARRRRVIATASCLMAVSVLLVILGIVGLETSDGSALLIVVGILLFIGAAIYGLLCARMVAPTRITDTHVWLKGVHPDFLADLPPCPFQS